MRMCCRTFFIVLWLAVSAKHSLADGLVFQLPKDGTKIVMAGDANVSSHIQLSPTVDKSTLSPEALKTLEPTSSNSRVEIVLSVVGTEMIAQKKCRWLQIALGEDGNVLELLVPEHLCARGRDPLAGSISTYFNWKDVDREAGKIVVPSGFDRTRYEIERFRPVFPAPLENAKELPRESLVTKSGSYHNCEVITGTTSFEGALLGNGYWECRTNVSLWLHKEAPFGVVQISYDSTSSEISEFSTTEISIKSVLQIESIQDGANRRLEKMDKRNAE
jgi:hypothetical protein